MESLSRISKDNKKEEVSDEVKGSQLSSKEEVSSIHIMSERINPKEDEDAKNDPNLSRNLKHQHVSPAIVTPVVPASDKGTEDQTEAKTAPSPINAPPQSKLVYP